MVTLPEEEDLNLIEGCRNTRYWIAVKIWSQSPRWVHGERIYSVGKDGSGIRTLAFTGRTDKWSAEEDAKLIDAVKKCGKDWFEVATLVPGTPVPEDWISHYKYFVRNYYALVVYWSRRLHVLVSYSRVVATVDYPMIQ
jgi:hypothetical protein